MKSPSLPSSSLPPSLRLHRCGWGRVCSPFLSPVSFYRLRGDNRGTPACLANAPILQASASAASLAKHGRRGVTFEELTAVAARCARATLGRYSWLLGLRVKRGSLE